MNSILIRNLKSLAGVREADIKMVCGAEMKTLPSIENAFLLIENGLIKSFGKNEDAPERADEIINAEGKFVLPAWCDSHTHIVYAGSRENEFADKINGLTYEEIAARGGGILNSAKRLNETTEEELLDSALQRLEEMKSFGTCAVEIKSGYGLNYEGEMKMLRVIRKLKEKSALTIKATFLGAHAYPLEFKNNHEGYLKLLLEELLPKIVDEGLADFIDVFCEENYFSVEETKRILETGAKFGLRAKVHVNQFNILGAVKVCVEQNALSVDHLELISDEDIFALKAVVGLPTNNFTMCTALPGCSLFLKIPYTPARKIIDAGLPLALATDFNPGSAPSGNMNLVNSLACINMNMTTEEVINASTLNGAYSMGVENELGSITIGKKANLIITKPVSSLTILPYSFGSNLVERVIVNGNF
ncbi:MAG: imidazolonepropionase [Bacteroidetes bacterium]|nr:imidazolonepropionase [Bacteroidota bacterium]